jgi:hypothetical protein
MTGGTLYFYEDNEDAANTTVAELKAGTETIHLSNGTTAAGAIKVPARKSKEAKVTIGKLANAPKVSANYVSGKVTIPKNAAYRIIKSTDANGLPDFTTASTSKVELTVASDEDKLTADVAFAIDVQTTVSGKLPSKIGHYTFDALEDTNPSDVEAGTPVVTTPKPGKSTPVTNQAIEYTNNSETNTYKISFYESGKTPGTDKAKSSITLQPKAAGSTKNVATLKKIPLDATITIARVGNSKNKVWAGPEVKFDGTSATGGSGSGNVETSFALTVTWTNVKSIKIGSETYTSSSSASLPAKVDENTEIVVTSKNDKTVTITGPDSSAIDDKSTTKTVQVDDEDTDVTVHTYTFSMPSKAVTIGE